ncbi:MAG: trimeric autotransporter adhesin, partial [Gaiellaceae bacterium]|nr:trimeric autotransporter adhesin [Gaiellaceae bacterium]
AGATGGTTDEGTPFTLAGSASGGDTTWAASGGTGTCSFSDATSPTSPVTCTDDGTYTLTLTANDHVNPPVSASTTLTVTNVPPKAALTLPTGPQPLAGSVSADVAISDPGADTFTCSLDWGDGTVTGGTVSGSACQGAHTYAAGGTWIVGATVTDDDGGIGTDSGAVTIDSPPTVTFPTLAPSGDEGSAIPISATTADDGTTASHWTATPDAGNSAGSSCTIADPSSLSTSATCNDNGTFTLTLAVDDGVNPTVTAGETLTVANVAPTVHITNATVSGGTTVTLAAAVADAGTNDVLTCSIDWGDGATSVVTAVAGACNATHTYAGSGRRTITVTGSDDDGGSSSASATVTLDQPPSCAAVTTSLATLWPPNGTFVTVTLSGAADADGDPLAYSIDGVTQDEPVAGAPDAQRLGGSGLRLRAQRDGAGDGRVYIVSYSVSDGRLSCAGTVRVTVAHDQAHAALLSAHSYNSLG